MTLRHTIIELVTPSASTVGVLRKGYGLLALTAVLVVLSVLLGCGGQTVPAGDTPAKSTPASTLSAEGQDTTGMSPDDYGMSLDDYLAICAGPTSGPIDAEFTLARLATFLGESAERLELVVPDEVPDEVAAWHDAVLAYQRALKEALDGAPGPREGESEDVYILGVLFPVGFQHQPAISEAIEGMDRDLVARMLEAGCIDQDILSMSLTEEEMKELGVGDGGAAGGRVITEFASISAGNYHACGVGIDGYVGCWGQDLVGKASPPDGEFSSVAAGWSHTCGVRADGTVACWGGGDDGEEDMPPGGEFISVSAGDFHTCGVRTDGSVACWGDDDDGQASPPTGKFVAVAAGYNHTCGIRADGSIACWGDEFDGQATPPEGEFVSVSAHGNTCAVRTDGSVACWGDVFLRKGLDKPQEEDFVSVSVGAGHFCGLRADGSVACWGWDDVGQSSPPEGEFLSVSAGLYYTCGIRAGASVACWGDDYDGQATPPGAP